MTQDGGNDIAFGVCTLVNCTQNVPLGSHTICPEFYNSAFEHPFYANNINLCDGVNTTNVPADFKMGFNELRKNIKGVFASPTYKKNPWNAPTASDTDFFSVLLGFLERLVRILF